MIFSTFSDFQEEYLTEMKKELQKTDFLSINDFDNLSDQLRNNMSEKFKKDKKSQNYDLVIKLNQNFETELRDAYKQIYFENEQRRDKKAKDTITESVDIYLANMTDFLKDKSFVKSLTFDEYSNEAKKLANKHFTDIFGEEEIDCYSPYLLKVILILI